MCFEQFIVLHEKLISSVNSALSAIAIVVGGLWAYLLFIRHRERYPSACVSQSIYSKRLNKSFRLVKVQIVVENTSNRLLSLDRGSVSIFQLLPLPIKNISASRIKEMFLEDKTEIDWPVLEVREVPLEEYEIEPKETDNICIDFIIPIQVRTIQIDTYIKNKIKKKDIGWNLTTVHDLNVALKRESKK